MWLLNTQSLRLEQFYDEIPQYAILSHRWQSGQELEFGDVTATAAHLAGHQKVVRLCEIAAQRGLKYAWADTCCIDQKSSAELSEAINSMFRWYRDATVCLVYLADVESSLDFANSAWFTRGWTLQELLAPSNLLFFGHTWDLLGSKQFLTSALEKITGIPTSSLLKFEATQYCVAEKMSWAANRRTTREEDRAYSLLGLFGVNMPMLYGEGAKAYERLQEEIMKTSTDTSLFLWTGKACKNFGMLASDPSCFSEFKNLPMAYQLTMARGKFNSERGWTLNNAGMNIRDAALQPCLVTDDHETVYTVSLISPPLVGFYIKQDKSSKHIRYRRVSINGRTSTEIRERSQQVVYIAGARAADIVISREPLEEQTISGLRGFLVSLKLRGFESADCTAHARPEGRDLLHEWLISSSRTGDLFNPHFVVSPTNNEGLLGFLRITFNGRHDLLICLGFNFNLKPFCVVIPFCSQLYNRARLRSHDILGAYYTLTGVNSEIRASPPNGVVFDEGSQIMAMTGTARDNRTFQNLSSLTKIEESLMASGLYDVGIEIRPNEIKFQFGATSRLTLADVFQPESDTERKFESPRRNLMPRAFA